MACRQRAGQSIEVIAGPAELPGRRADHHSRIRYPRADDDVRALIERFLDAPGAKIGICREHLVTRLSQRDASVHVGEGLARRRQLVDARRQIVAIDVGHLGVHAQLVQDLLHVFGHARGIQPAGIGDDLDVLLFAQHRHFADLLKKGAHVAGIAATALLLVVENGHGQLGQVVAGEHIDRTTFHHVPGGG